MFEDTRKNILSDQVCGIKKFYMRSHFPFTFFYLNFYQDIFIVQWGFIVAIG